VCVSLDESETRCHFASHVQVETHYINAGSQAKTEIQIENACTSQRERVTHNYSAGRD